jgi:hypothetical protein
MGPGIDAWLAAAEKSIDELLASAVACEGARPLARSESPPTGLAGSYLQMVSDLDMVQLGLVADPAALDALARGLLGSAPSEPLSPADVADAVGEIVNMAAGGLKRRVGMGGLVLGLPLFIHGHIAVSDRLEARVSHLRLGTGHEVALVVIAGRRMSSAAAEEAA